MHYVHCAPPPLTAMFVARDFLIKDILRVKSKGVRERQMKCRPSRPFSVSPDGSLKSFSCAPS